MQNLGNACMFWNILLALIKVVEMQLPYTHSIINSLLLCLIQTNSKVVLKWMDGVKGFLLTEKAAQGDTEGLQRQLDQCTVSFVFLRNLLKSYIYHLFFFTLPLLLPVVYYVKSDRIVLSISGPSFKCFLVCIAITLCTFQSSSLYLKILIHNLH